MDRLAQISHVSIGYPGVLPAIRVRAVRARSTDEALSRLLKGTGLRAVRVGSDAYRIELQASPKDGAPVGAPSPRIATEPVIEPEIIVTAQKRTEPLASVAATLRVVPGADARAAGGLPGSAAIVRNAPALSMSNLGPGRNRLFLRGVGDSAFDGFGQGSVAILLDEARLIYDAPDPNLLLIDVENVELLEGPQGPLYGTGAIGGIMKIVTVKPDLLHPSASAALGLSSTEEGDTGYSASAIVNIPLKSDRLALRASAYHQIEPGWIDIIRGKSDANRGTISGGRLAIRWQPAESWTIDLAGALQSNSARDSQYVDGELGPYERAARHAEPRDSDAHAASLTVNGEVGELRLTSVTSLSRQEVNAVYAFGPSSTADPADDPFVSDDRRYTLFDQEIRLSGPDRGNVGWFVGASLLRASTRADIVGTGAAPAPPPHLQFRRDALEMALFGEARFKLTPRLSATAGIRLLRSNVDDEESEDSEKQSVSRASLRAVPSFSIGWQVAAHQFVFGHIATGYRPGGIGVGNDGNLSATYRGDQLDSAEVGWRGQLTRRIDADATVFASRWTHVQADVLLEDGLVSTQNVGDASNIGAEATVRFAAGRGSAIDAGIIVQDSRLEVARDIAIDVEDRRLPVIPNLALRAGASQHVALGGWDASARLDVRYTGATHLSFDPNLDERMGARVTLDAGIDLARDGWTIAIDGENLTASHADSFAFGNPYSIRSAEQRTPLKPRTFGVRVTRRF